MHICVSAGYVTPLDLIPSFHHSMIFIIVWHDTSYWKAYAIFISCFQLNLVFGLDKNYRRLRSCSLLYLFIYFYKEFQPMTSAPDDIFLLSDQDTNQFLV